MSEDLIVALILCVLGAGAIIIAAVFAFKQKVYYDPNNQVTEIEVPFMGKLKTNTPVIGLCFLGVVLGYFAYDMMKSRTPKLVKFEGEISVDRDSIANIDAVLVGITSGSWVHTSTPTGTTPSFAVAITVPNSWPSYSAYAFAIGGGKMRPAMIGATLEEPKFKLSIR